MYLPPSLCRPEKLAAISSHVEPTVFLRRSPHSSPTIVQPWWRRKRIPARLLAPDTDGAKATEAAAAAKSLLD